MAGNYPQQQDMEIDEVDGQTDIIFEQKHIFDVSQILAADRTLLKKWEDFLEKLPLRVQSKNELLDKLEDSKTTTIRGTLSCWLGENGRDATVKSLIEFFNKNLYTTAAEKLEDATFDEKEDGPNKITKMAEILAEDRAVTDDWDKIIDNPDFPIKTATKNQLIADMKPKGQTSKGRSIHSAMLTWKSENGKKASLNSLSELLLKEGCKSASDNLKIKIREKYGNPNLC